MDKSNVFKLELSQIKNTELRNAIIDYFENCVPDYFWTMPASTTGKYHPDQDTGDGGLARHSRMVTQVAIAMMQLEMWSALKPYEDDIYAACLIHDTWKLGDIVTEYEQGKTYTAHNHPLFASYKFYEFIQTWPNASDELKKHCQIICHCVETHMGQWNKPRFSSAGQVLKKPESAIQKFVHLCDYIASRNFIGTLDKIDGKI